MQQLLRTLNLNSPAPPHLSGGYTDNGSFAASPDVSPISTTSGLHTPPDVSPAKAFGEWKLNANYDFGPVYQTQPNEGLLFQTSNQLRYHDYMNVSPGIGLRPSPPGDGYPSQTRALPSLPTFPDRSPSGSSNDVFSQMDFPPTHIRQESVAQAMPSSSWNQQRLRSSSAEWMKPEERRVDHSSGDHSIRSSHSAHEVCIFIFLIHVLSNGRMTAHQLPFLIAPVVDASLSSLRISHHQVLRPAGVHLSATEAQGRRL